MDDASISLGLNTSLFEKALNFAQDAMDGFSTFLNTKFVDSSGKVESAAEIISSTFKAAFASLTESATVAADKMKTVFVDASAAISTAVTGAFGVALAVGSSVVDGLKAVFSKVTGFITAPFKAAYSVITGVFSGLSSVMSKVTSSIAGAFSSVYGKVKGVISDIYGSVQQLIPLLGVGLAVGLAHGFSALQEDENALSKMNAVLKATGGVVGYTSDQLTKMADAAAAASGAFGGDAFNNAQTVLLQFKNVRADVFEGAMKAAEDFAIATGTDLSGAADKLGRALDDPIKGMRILRSEGIVFSEDQQKVIQSMLASGKVMEAQRLILSRVAGTFGGAAAGAADTFSGKIHQLNEALDDQWKAFAQALVPAIEAVIPWLIRGAKSSQAWGEALGENVKMVVDWVNSNTALFKKWYDYAVDVFKKVGFVVIDSLGAAFTYVETAIQDLPDYFTMAVAKLRAVWEEMSQGLKTVWETVTVYVENLWNKLFTNLKKAFLGFLVATSKMALQLPGAELFLGKDTKKQLEHVIKATEAGIKRIKPSATKVAGGTSDEDKERLEKLRKAAEGASTAFNDRFTQNMEKNKGFIDSIKEKFASALGFDPAKVGAELGKAKASAADFVFNKDPAAEQGNKGAFEDLLSLQKRIAGAAFKSPEAQATEGQTSVIKQHHKESIEVQKKVVEKIDKQIEETKKINDHVNANAGEGTIIG